MDIRPGMVGVEPVWDSSFGFAATLGQALIRPRAGRSLRYAHAFIITSWDADNDFGFDVSSSADGGAYIEPADDFDLIHALVFDPFPDLDDHERRRIAEHAEALVGSPYSFRAIARVGLSALLRRDLAPTGPAPFCSALVAESFARAGHPLFDKPSHLVTPSDLADLARSSAP